MSKHPKRRKKLYLSRAIQGRLLWRLSCYWILYLFVFWHVLFFCEGLIVDGHLVPIGQAYAAFFNSHFILLACALAVFLVVFRDMLKMTHGIAGAFVPFERALRKMTRGERVDPVVLRKTDLIHEFQAVFNEFIEYRNHELSRHPALAETGPCTKAEDGEGRLANDVIGDLAGEEFTSVETPVT